MKTKIWSVDSAFGANSLRSDACSHEKVRVHPVVIFRWLITTVWEGSVLPTRGSDHFVSAAWLVYTNQQNLGFIHGSFLLAHNNKFHDYKKKKRKKRIHTCHTIRALYNLWTRLTPIPAFSPSSALTQNTACQFRLINLLDTLPSAEHK